MGSRRVAGDRRGNPRDTVHMAVRYTADGEHWLGGHLISIGGGGGGFVACERDVDAGTRVVLEIGAFDRLDDADRTDPHALLRIPAHVAYLDRRADERVVRGVGLRIPPLTDEVADRLEDLLERNPGPFEDVHEQRHWTERADASMARPAVAPTAADRAWLERGEVIDDEATGMRRWTRRLHAPARLGLELAIAFAATGLALGLTVFGLGGRDLSLLPPRGLDAGELEDLFAVERLETTGTTLRAVIENWSTLEPSEQALRLAQACRRAHDAGYRRVELHSSGGVPLAVCRGAHPLPATGI